MQKIEDLGSGIFSSSLQPEYKANEKKKLHRTKFLFVFNKSSNIFIFVLNYFLYVYIIYFDFS